MQTQDNSLEQVQNTHTNPDFPAPEPVTPSPEPVIPPSEPVTPPGEPGTPPSEPRGNRVEERSSVQRDPVLEGKIAAAEAVAAERENALLSLAADMEVMQRRAKDDLARAQKYAIEAFAEALVPVKDSLEAALSIKTSDYGSYREGVEMTARLLSTAFTKNRLLEINPGAGERFDPVFHQAISVAPSDQEADTVVHVLQKGYLLGEEILRPALVTISGQKPGAKPPARG